MKRMKKWIVTICLCLVTALVVPIVIPNMEYVSVVQAATNVKLNKTKGYVTKGQTIQLKISGTKKKAKWNTSNKKIATVNSKGVVKGIKKGTATITAKVNGKKYKCKIIVETPKISKTKVTVIKGKTVTLAMKNTKQKVKWSTSNKKVATVNSKGVVKGIKKGIATITAKIGSKKYKCKVTVKNSANQTQVAIDAYNKFLSQGDYGKYVKKWDTVAAQYGILDINKDDVPELFIDSVNMGGWFYTLIFTYKPNTSKIVFISEEYHYGAISYSNKNNAILFTDIKPSARCGFYNFYELKDTILKWRFCVGNDEDENGNYYFYQDETAKKIITEECKQEYFSDLTEIKYTNLPNISQASSKFDLENYFGKNIYDLIETNGDFDVTYIKEEKCIFATLPYVDITAQEYEWNSTGENITSIRIWDGADYCVAGIECGMLMSDAYNLAIENSYLFVSMNESYYSSYMQFLTKDKNGYLMIYTSDNKTVERISLYYDDNLIKLLEKD